MSVGLVYYFTLLLWYVCMLRVHSIETFWTHEWPGIRFVLFLQWCVFKCLYCHNPDTISSTGWTLMTPEELVPKICKMKDYFWSHGWLTVSWWEPLLQAKQLLPLFAQLKKEWIHIAIDTNGFVRNADVQKLLAYVDLVLLDLKHMDNHWHKKITWQPNERVHAFLDHMEEIQKPTWIRYVYVPGYTDQLEYMHSLWATFGSYTCIQRIEILPYHTLGVQKWKHLGWKYSLDHVASPHSDAISCAKSIFAQYFPLVLSR